MPEVLSDADMQAIAAEIGVPAVSQPLISNPAHLMEVFLQHKDALTALMHQQAELTPDEQAEQVTITLPDGLVPAEWVIQQFDAHKGNSSDGRTKDVRKAYNKALYKRLQDARTHHNAAIKSDMRAQKVQVVSGEVAKRVREATEQAGQPLDIDDTTLNALAEELVRAFVKASK